MKKGRLKKKHDMTMLTITTTWKYEDSLTLTSHQEINSHTYTLTKHRKFTHRSKIKSFKSMQHIHDARAHITCELKNTRCFL